MQKKLVLPNKYAMAPDEYIKQEAREELLSLCKSIKDDYIIVHEYLMNRQEKPKAVKEAYQRMHSQVSLAIAKYESERHEVFEFTIGCPWAWQFGGHCENINLWVLEQRASKIAQCRPDRMIRALKKGMEGLTMSVKKILLSVEVHGCIQGYCLDDQQLELVDLEEMARQEEKRRQEEEAKKHIKELLDGRACEELVAYLEANAQKKPFVMPDTQEQTYYYKFNDRLYDSHGQRFGYANVKKWNLVDEM